MGKWIGIAVVGLLVVAGISCAGTYNSLVTLDQQVQSQWAQVENVYQRRMDLVPNLVETVKGAAAFEKETYTQVAEARAKAGQSTIDASKLSDQGAFDRFQQSQDALSSSLSRLLVVAERYPELKADVQMRRLAEELTSTENRVAFARQAYNDAVMQYNTACEVFPASLLARAYGHGTRAALLTFEPGIAAAPVLGLAT